MAKSESFIAKKEYPCSRCKGIIRKGQEYHKRIERSGGAGCAEYTPLRWHSKITDCQQPKGGQKVAL